MSKTLSNGLLSLRFMQNAQRAKQLKEVELHRAEVADDGKWAVSKAIREAWGLTQDRKDDEDADIHEASYLPFLYSNTNEGSLEDCSSVAIGRRVFNHTNLDMQDDDAKGKDAATSTSSSKPSKSRIHAHPRPISISNMSKATVLKGFDDLNGAGRDDETTGRQQQRRKPESRALKSTARELIFQSGNVGLDLRDQASASTSSKPTPTPKFMKPAGVDDPHEARRASAPNTEESASAAQVVDGARPRKTKKGKREADQDGDEEEVRKRPKKKKKKEKI